MFSLQVLGSAAVRLLLAVAVMGLGLAAAAAAGGNRSAPPNPIQAENALPGSTGWSGMQSPGHAIEGYTSEVSVLPGGRLELHVSTTPAERYRVEIYRLGWYGGLGGRLLVCLPACSGDEQGVARSVPAAASDGYLDAGWPVTDSLTIPAGWVSGYYVAALRLTTGASAGRGGWVPFVVRAPEWAPPAAVLVQASVNTWQAYNRWGGWSLYRDPTGATCHQTCTHVSFDRPYDPKTQNFWDYELPLVHFLEEHGYDVSYTTDVDTDRDPGELLRHRLVIVAGHDEYWTSKIRDAFDAARAAGTNLMFTGANTGYWQMRYADGGRTIVEYRKAAADPEPDPRLKTVTFRSLGRPECQLEGVQFQRVGGEGIGGPYDYPVAPGALTDPWFRGTSFTQSSVLPGAVGYEWDSLVPGCATPPTTVLFHYGGPVPADAVRFTAPSGARVFSAGSLNFAKGLNDIRGAGNPGLEQFMRNALADLTRPAGPLWVLARRTARGVVVRVGLGPDPRIEIVRVIREGARRYGSRLVCSTRSTTCVDRGAPRGRVLRYAVVVRDRWASSVPMLSAPVP
jgi:hypothetical protein